MKNPELCICGSRRRHSECCGPFLDGSKTPRTAKQLMRSRYAAYALSGHGDYLKRTWHPAKAAQLSMADLDGDDYSWTGLEILNSGQKGDVAQVEFKATFQDEQGIKQSHHEISTFLRQNGQWYYFDAQFPEEKATSGEPHTP